MKAEDYHRSMEPLKAACDRARSGWICLSNPLVGGKLAILGRHFLLIFKVYKIRHRRILVREFSILPLLAIFPLLWPLRKKVWFVVHHNLQWAVRNPLQRFGLRCLALMGAQWALLETQDFPESVAIDNFARGKITTIGSGSCLENNMGAGSACFRGLEKFKIPSSRNLVFPHPVPDVGQTFLSAQSATAVEPPQTTHNNLSCGGMRHQEQPTTGQQFPTKNQEPRTKNRGEAPPVIGVAGDYRPEKGTDELIRLLKEKLPEFEILLGVPNPEEVTHLDVETVCTATDAEYHQMLSRCDVLVLNGEKESYFYRASGPVADAAAAGTAVVAPDFPIIGKQVAGIGEVFQPLEKMPEAVRRAVAAGSSGAYDFKAYCHARSEEALADCLDEFVVNREPRTVHPPGL